VENAAAPVRANLVAACHEELRRVRVGVILPGLHVPAWQEATLRGIAAGSYAELVVLVLLTAENAPPSASASMLHVPHSGSYMRRRLARAVCQLESKFACEHDAFAERDLAAVFSDKPRVYFHRGAIDEAARKELLGFDLDVLVDLTASNIALCLARAATHGLWTLGEPHVARIDPAIAAFWPVYHGTAVSEARLCEVSPEGIRRTIATARPATNPLSMRLTGSGLYWRIASLITTKLRELQRLPVAYGAPADAAEPDAPGESRAQPQWDPPNAKQLATYAVRNIQRRARASWSRRFMLDQWILLAHFGADLVTSPLEFKQIVPPKDRLWADPHVIRRDGRFYVFIEEVFFTTGKGHIAVLPINPDGTYDKSVPVLEREYHLSYPFVFEHEGTLFMVPESSGNRTIDLYRCTDFPGKWELVATLMENILATDSTLLQAGGKWWLFANVINNPGESYSEELFLFHAESLTGKWTAHLRNPIVSDCRRSRPAGPILERDGRLYRPAQDCSVRYGYGIRIHEITHLTETEYSEREVSRIAPTWDPAIIATHTLSYTPGLTVLDALQPRLRF
jgi:hypothetical protein